MPAVSEDHDSTAEISKSARKREATAAQDLGVELADLTQAQLDELDLPEKLRDAIEQLGTIKSRPAQVRQRQFIGKLMRHVEIEPIVATLERRKHLHDAEVRRFQRLEHWRDRLIDDAAIALPEFLALQAGADRGKLERLIFAAQRERRAAAAPKSARELFVYLRSFSGL
jgi:ribosome-associated protein